MVLKLELKLGSALSLAAAAQRRQEHPTVLTEIELLYRLRGDELDAETVRQAIQVAEDMLCPVLAMLRPGTQIRSSWRLD